MLLDKKDFKLQTYMSNLSLVDSPEIFDYGVIVDIILIDVIH